MDNNRALFHGEKDTPAVVERVDISDDFVTLSFGEFYDGVYKSLLKKAIENPEKDFVYSINLTKDEKGLLFETDDEEAEKLNFLQKISGAHGIPEAKNIKFEIEIK